MVDSAETIMANKKNKTLLHDESFDHSRRNLLKSAGVVGAAVGTGTATNVIAQDSPRTNLPTSPITREALEILTAEEAETVESICNRLIPSDEHGPGASEARAVHYIDKSLASHNKDVREHYMVSIEAINRYAGKTRGHAFHQLIDDHQNSILLALQNNKVPGCLPSGSGFFNMIRSHTIDGTFCDPYYGGNQNFVGWDMLKYPGIRLSASETDVAQGAALEPNHQSAYDHDTYTKMASNRDMDQRRGGGNA
jgi:gluconate 2-dehydrogenase gamma chain